MLEYFSAAKTLLDCFGAIKEHAKKAPTAQRQDFDRLLTPIFESLTPLIDDYFEMIRTAHTAVAGASSRLELVAAADLLKAQRMKFLGTRIRVREEANALHYAIDDSDARRFLASVARLFDAPYRGVVASRRMSGFSYVVQTFSDMEHLHPAESDWRDSRQHIRISIGEMEEFLETHWAKVSSEYHALRALHHVKGQLPPAEL